MPGPLTQPSFAYDGDTGKVSGSDTSEAHAGWEKSRANSVQEIVLEHIRKAGTGGLTCQEVEDLTGLPHQSASASIRNMEIDPNWYDDKEPFSRYNCGRVVKLATRRGNQHAYIARTLTHAMPSDALQAPNRRRASFKRDYDELRDQIGGLLKEMPSSSYWYSKLSRIHGGGGHPSLDTQ